MVLGSVSEKHILITQSVRQSYNSGSMFAYVAHGGLRSVTARLLCQLQRLACNVENEIFPKAQADTGQSTQ